MFDSKWVGWLSGRTIWSAVLLAILVGAPVGASDWPQWRGPNRDGVSTEVGLASSWSEGGPAVVWSQLDIGEGYGSIAIADSRVLVQGTRGGRSLVFAFSEIDGRPLWTHDLGPRLVQDKGNGPRSTPTIVGNEVYVLNEMGELARLNAATGVPVWQVNILKRAGSPNPRWGLSESPLVVDDRIYLMPGGSRGAVVALDRLTGEQRWSSRGLTDQASYSSLVMTDLDGLPTLVGFTQQAGVGVAAEDGRLLWRYEAPANPTANAATPVVGDGRIFYTSSYGIGGGAVDVTKRGAEVESKEAWFGVNLQNHHGGVVLHNGYLYGFFGPALVCADFATGEVVWRARSVGKGTLTLADGKLFLLGERHEMGLAEVSPVEYRELGRFEIVDRGQPSWAHPAVSNGRLYVRNWDQLTVYDVAADAMPAATAN